MLQGGLFVFVVGVLLVKGGCLRKCPCLVLRCSGVAGLVFCKEIWFGPRRAKIFWCIECGWRLLYAAVAVPEFYRKSMFLARRAKFFWYIECPLPVAGFACSGLALRLPGACFALVVVASVAVALVFSSC